jgi:hypothetical protein
MTRNRFALVLGAVAVLAMLATVALAVATYVGDDDPPPVAEPLVGPLVVRDPASGASFEVPGEDWEVRGPRSRIYYEDDRGRPTAAVAGAAVYRDGYCDEQPGDSNRGFAGFTDQPFDTWLESLTDGGGTWSTGKSREEVVLADGTTGTLRWIALLGGEGACTPAGIEAAMVQAGDVRVVLVADSDEAGTLSHDDVRRILLTLRVS